MPDASFLPPWPPRWPEIERSIGELIQSGDWGRYHSPVAEKLRGRLREFFGVSHVRICCSGTAALETALRALNIGTGDEVILAALDYPGNFRTVELCGAKPVLVDLAANSPCIDPCHLQAAEGPHVRAVIASHLFGRSADVATIRRQCNDRGWALIEDACQVPGMEIQGRMAGSFGDVGLISFGGSKIISAGNGGALLTDSDRLAARVASLLDRPGDVLPLSALQAAAICPQLDRLAEMNRLRGDTAVYLKDSVDADLSRWTLLSRPEEGVTPAHYKLAWHAESTDHRARVIEACGREGLPVGAGFRTMSRCSDRRCRKPLPTPNADRLSETLFVLDHRALMIDIDARPRLAGALRSAHDSS